jgi:PKD repeat protein
VHDGEWHSVRCEKLSSSVKLTVDGRSFTSSKTVGSISNGADLLVASHGTGEFFPGDLDELVYSLGSGAAVPPTASFTAKPTSGTAPLKVSFKDTSTGSPATWAWDFGDGSTSTSQSPTHTYNSPGDFTATLKVTNAAGSDTETTTVEVEGVVDTPRPDTSPPTGTFRVTPSAGWAAYTGVVLTQTAIADNVTAAGTIRRAVDWKDGRGAVAWSSGSTITHTYAAAGRYAPTVTLTDESGNSAPFSTAPVVVRADTAAPVAGLSRPAKAKRASAAAWRTLRGRVSDAGTGVSFVNVRVVEKRRGAWYAYRPASHTWVKAATRAAALRKSRAGRALIGGTTQWSLRMVGAHKGTLLVRLVAGDHVGNTSRLRTYSQRLTRG